MDVSNEESKAIYVFIYKVLTSTVTKRGKNCKSVFCTTIYEQIEFIDDLHFIYSYVVRYVACVNF